MQIYLPIAEISVNIFLIIGLGALVGILSGMFGVGDGFLMTPLLFFIGIPPAIAVATEANQIVGSSFSGALAHFKRRALDLKMGLVLTIGGSTTDQRYVNEGATWQDNLDRLIPKYDFINGGIDGQSSYGHLISMRLWHSQTIALMFLLL